MATTPLRRAALTGLASLLQASLLATLLSSCYRQPSVLPPPPVTRAPAPVPAPSPREAANLSDYKIQVAQHIAAANPKLIFYGTLPPMLPAIVVLDFTIDGNGNIGNLHVHRSRDDDASSIAMNAVRQATPLPRPGSLLKGGRRTLAMTETFLFNRDYQFQLRTLAGPQ
ncbi:MAG TPA: energy transducer TonB [Burkholderiaceae bacterium]|jgi:periplasmic protein TonB|nr:energy transducer TonB [Burkholderiaceae bacterium]